MTVTTLPRSPSDDEATGEEFDGLLAEFAPTAPGEASTVGRRLRELTDREREVTGMLVRGFSVTEISRGLWISPHTVRDHVKAVFRKFGVGTRPELTALVFYHFVLPTISAQLRDTRPDTNRSWSTDRSIQAIVGRCP